MWITLSGVLLTAPSSRSAADENAHESVVKDLSLHSRYRRGLPSSESCRSRDAGKCHNSQRAAKIK